MKERGHPVQPSCPILSPQPGLPESSAEPAPRVLPGLLTGVGVGSASALVR